MAPQSATYNDIADTFGLPLDALDDWWPSTPCDTDRASMSCAYI